MEGRKKADSEVQNGGAKNTNRKTKETTSCIRKAGEEAGDKRDWD